MKKPDTFVMDISRVLGFTYIVEGKESEYFSSSFIKNKGTTI
jgi:hypothetical protein